MTTPEQGRDPRVERQLDALYSHIENQDLPEGLKDLTMSNLVPQPKHAIRPILFGFAAAAAVAAIATFGVVTHADRLSSAPASTPTPVIIYLTPSPTAIATPTPVLATPTPATPTPGAVHTITASGAVNGTMSVSTITCNGLSNGGAKTIDVKGTIGGMSYELLLEDWRGVPSADPSGQPYEVEFLHDTGNPSIGSEVWDVGGAIGAGPSGVSSLNASTGGTFDSSLPAFQGDGGATGTLHVVGSVACP